MHLVLVTHVGPKYNEVKCLHNLYWIGHIFSQFRRIKVRYGVTPKSAYLKWVGTICT